MSISAHDLNVLGTIHRLWSADRTVTATKGKNLNRVVGHPHVRRAFTFSCASSPHRSRRLARRGKRWLPALLDGRRQPSAPALHQDFATRPSFAGYRSHRCIPASVCPRCLHLGPMCRVLLSFADVSKREASVHLCASVCRLGRGVCGDIRHCLCACAQVSVC